MPPSSSLYRRKECRLCGSKSFVLALQLEPSPIGDAFVPSSRLGEQQRLYPIDLFLCRECGLAQLRDVIDPRILYRDYLYVTASSEGLGDHFRRYVEDVLGRWVPPPGSMVVDLGSNDGLLLGFFKARGLRVLGVDPAVELAQRVTTSGIETLPIFFTHEVAIRLRQERGPASIITANNMFANIDNLVDLTEGIRALLSSSGIFVMESYYLPDILRNMVFDFIYHEHISSFTVRPLRDFFERHGLELVDVLKVPTKGGSVRYYVQPRGGPRPVSPAVKALIAEENELGVFHPDIFRSFAGKVSHEKDALLSILKKLKVQGNSIAAYGACITGTTLLYHFGIGSFIDFIVDDNPVKQGLFSPGFHIPVYPPDQLCQRMPTHVLLLAWRYSEGIIRKNKEYLERGGHFIIMGMPGIKII
ncbi:MAG: class I SAM-dependent methyltransferase [Elusimicrobia bacterium]|nr:class I SAM-dependent methyltransferase [Elusimicrobiota bacterium]